MTSKPAKTGPETSVLSLICVGHFVSHYSQLVLPPLFPLMQSDFNVGYASLGIMITLINTSGAMAQLPIGFFVDYFGAKKILLSGLLIKTFSIGAMSLTNSYEFLLILSLFAGLGHAVFHPADYSILMSSMKKNQMGKAFSIHTASGTAGGAVAPLVIVTIAQVWNWKIAVLSVALLGGVTGIAMLVWGNILHDHIRSKTNKVTQKNTRVLDSLRLLLAPNVLVLYIFFITTAMISIGLNTYIVTTLVELHHIPLHLAGIILTIFLIFGVLGILFGGYLADITEKHNLIAASAFLLSSFIIVLIGTFKLSLILLIFCFSLVGFFLGLVRPARDMMVRAITPDGDAGKMFGFMSTGHLMGGVLVPVLYGWVIDQGHVQWVFWITAIFMILALLALCIPAKRC